MNKKFILFIVEGQNDEQEINAILHSPCFSQYSDKYRIEFYCTNGDITSKKELNEKNILKKLNEIVLDFRRNKGPYNNIKPSDIHEVVQITDLDGCFIPRDCVIYGDEPEYVYTDNSIITSAVTNVYGRNRKKADILLKLVDTKQVSEIPYSIYFVSCNMDHLLFNIRTNSAIEKNKLAQEFQIKCSQDLNLLNQSIFNEDVCFNTSYLESWDEMLYECNSLKRRSNFNLFFSDKAKNRK